MSSSARLFRASFIGEWVRFSCELLFAWILLCLTAHLRNVFQRPKMSPPILERVGALVTKKKRTVLQVHFRGRTAHGRNHSKNVGGRFKKNRSF